MILPIFENKETGILSLQNNLVSLLKIGTTFFTLHISGKILVSKNLFTNFASGKETVFLVCFRRIVGILLVPVLILPIKIMMISFTCSAVVD